MKNEQLKFVIDFQFYRGYCLTSLSDGMHSDYGGETLEELRIQENNPYLVVISPDEIYKRNRIYEQSLCAPFREITEEDYDNYLNVLPPIRYTGRFFFVGEPYSGSLYPFCFTVGGRYFKGLYSVRAPKDELERVINRHYRQITFKGKITKGMPQAIADKNREETGITPYSFIDAENRERFICNLVISPDDTESLHKARREMVHTLLSLRKHHFLYFSDHDKWDDIEKFLDKIVENQYTLLANDKFFQFPTNRESVSFTGSIKETGKSFFYRIYDRELFLHLMYKLRSIKRETTRTSNPNEEQ